MRRADATIAAEFIAETIAGHGTTPGHGTLTVHADRDTEMTAQLVGTLLDRLETMKYAAELPDRFAASSTP